MDRPIFIIGCGRSGTTLLREIMNQAPDLFILRESGFIPELYKERKKYGRFSTDEAREEFIDDLKTFERTSRDTAFDIFEMSESKARMILEEVSPTNFAGAVSALYSATALQKGGEIWGDKTPLYTSHIDLIKEVYPSAKIIHIIRDPRDVSKSIKKAGWSLTLKGAARIWKKQIRKGLEGRQLDEDSYYEIKYESLLISPRTELKKLFGWLDISYPEDLVDRYEKSGAKIDSKFENLHQNIGRPIQKSRAFSWKKNMKKADIAIIEKVAETEIKRTEYEITGYNIPITRKILSVFLDITIPAGKKIKRIILQSG